MRNKKIYTLHEYGAPSHFYGLEFLVNENNSSLEHRELNLFIQFGSSVKRLSIKRFRKFLTNLFFMIFLCFTKNKKIVVGLAPYNNNLRFLKFLFRGHAVYYFTSYTCWNQSRMVHSKFYSSKLLKVWKDFTNHQVKHIFVVSALTKHELVKNGFSKSENITIVNHSYNIEITPADNLEKYRGDFIAVGQLSYNKGIDELLEIFKNLPNCNLTIVGDGYLKDEVIEATQNYKNICYKGFVKGLENLIPIYKEHAFLILNSKKTEKWEELFGLVLIEGMACGLVPIATKHPGPKEVITNNMNGILCDEGNVLKGIQQAIEIDGSAYSQMKENAVIKASEFHCSKISERWKIILEN